MKTRLSFFTALVSLVCFASLGSAWPQATEKKAAPAKAAATSSSAPVSVWQDIGERGQVLKVWTSVKKKGVPEIIVLLLNRPQLAALEKDPVGFINKKPRLFSKDVIDVWGPCGATIKSAFSGDSDDSLVFIEHGGYSDTCGAAFPLVPLKNKPEKRATASK